MMDHTQTVFLGHFIPAVIAFWIYCWCRSPESKKARQMLKHQTDSVEIVINPSIPQKQARSVVFRVTSNLQMRTGYQVLQKKNQSPVSD